jgi:DNA-binding transcriptional MerR regulator
MFGSGSRRLAVAAGWRRKVRMMSEYRIGAFAEASGVSAKTLRFYDQVGLLRPARIDPRTRYRLYLPEQLQVLAAIVELKQAGVSLADIRRLVRSPAADNGWRQLLHDLRIETQRKIEQAAQSLKWIDSLLEQGEEPGRPLPVMLKRRPALAIASIRSRLNRYEDVDGVEKELLQALPAAAVGGVRGVLWHRCAGSDYLEGEPFVALRRRIRSSGPYDVRELPAATLACAYSRPDDDSAEQAYKALSQWTEVKGYRLTGPKREICHPELLEVQFPVTPA